MSGNRVYLIVLFLMVILSSCLLYAPPEIVEPLEDHPVASSSPEISWLDVEKAVGYQYQWNNSGNFSSESHSGVLEKRTDIQLESLSDGTYFFRVRALFPKGKKGRWSKIRQFSVKSVLPVIAIPAEGQQYHLDEDFLLAWQGLPSAEYYEIQMASDEIFRDILFSETGITGRGEIRYTVPGQSKGQYYLRIRAVLAGGNVTDWSSVRSVDIQSGYPVVMNEPAAFGNGNWNTRYYLLNGNGEAKREQSIEGFYTVDKIILSDGSLLAVGYIKDQEEYSLWENEAGRDIPGAFLLSPEGDIVWEKKYQGFSWFRILKERDDHSVSVLVSEDDSAEPRILKLTSDGESEVLSKLVLRDEEGLSFIRLPHYSTGGKIGRLWSGEGYSSEDAGAVIPSDPRSVDANYLNWGFFPETRFGWAAVTDLFGGILWQRSFSEIQGFIPSFFYEEDERLWLAGTVEIPGQKKSLLILQLNPQDGEILSRTGYALQDGFGLLKSMVLDDIIVISHYNTLFLFSKQMEFQKAVSLESAQLKDLTGYHLYTTDIFSDRKGILYVQGLLYFQDLVVDRWIVTILPGENDVQCFFSSNSEDQPHEGYMVQMNELK